MKYCFNGFDIDATTRELSGDGKAVQVEPQVFDLILFLVRNQGKLVSHDDLVGAVWEGRIVSDSAISARISAARKALGDSGKLQTVIRTISRKGFRFLPAVTVQPVDNLSDAAVKTSPDPSGLENIGRKQELKYCKSADGTRLAYAATGSGVPLIRVGHWLTHLEHDWNSPIWRPFLDQLGKRFQVVRYDQRGCGLSDREVSDFSFERFIEDFESVANASGFKRFVLYATSQGVPIAVDYAVRNPGRISHLVLHGGYVSGRLVRSNDAEREQGEAILKLLEHGWGVVGSPFLKSFTTMYIPNSSKNQMDSLVELQRLTTDTKNAISIRKAADSFDVSALLGQVGVKTLVLHALNDGVHPVTEGRALAAGIPDSQLIVLESSNHALLPEEPAWSRFFWELEQFTES